jgi:hypothetical protein
VRKDYLLEEIFWSVVGFDVGKGHERILNLIARK